MSKVIPTIFYKELEQELSVITQYWELNAVDSENGGFVGQRDHYNNLVVNANKGIILNSRILWSFSAIANYSENFNLVPMLERSYTYLKDNFRDKRYGGVYWELDFKGQPVNKKKQVYAQAFTIYSLSEYYLYSKNEEAKKWAISLFELIEKYALDKQKGGYIEAFQEDWSPINDMRLSNKDKNASKTMNTHLHVLEAYTTLYKIYPEVRLKAALENLVELFLEKFLNSDYNFELFFDDDWNLQSDIISFGHDIEALWLIIEAAKVTGNQELLKQTEAVAIPIADSFLAKAYIKGKGVLNEEDRLSGEVDTDRHWWPQAEAMVGLFYAYKLSKNNKYANALLDIWEFTTEHIIDHKNGEWFFRVDENYIPYKNENKLGMWKCPYHNSRACIVLLKSQL
ncbi:AGE family epimerase/isomerase [Gillisia sp. M10.2A]|uniref:Cellobiose 2-epimerase n=1 Tax=Gillisia lutea TaxID=2909668 RepID=A0ABS9EE73_9FLAO|nr:AGE family epimerase/isomerase [Gillisia lutea]MCF4101181.1 AGE family epimerase/isomerase [Gillisia lutea]